MAGPSYTGVRTVIDPFEGLQKAVSNAGDIYREYEKSSREADLHNAKMQEVERVNHQREFLRNYDPQLGVQGKGLSDDTKRFAQAEEERIVQHFAEAAARGEEVPSPEELRKRISADYGKLATQESAQQAIMQDLLAQGFKPDAAAAQAQALTGGLVSRASLYEQEKDRVEAQQKYYEAIREAGDRTFDRQAQLIQANAAVLRAENQAQERLLRLFGGGGAGGSRPAPREKWQDTKDFREGIDEAIGGWFPNIDGPAAMDVIHRGLEAYNAERRAEGKPELPKSEAYNYAYESIGPDWIFGRDISAQTPGEFQVELKERFDNNPDAFRPGGRYGSYGAVGSLGGAGGVGSSVLTELDQNTLNMLRDVRLVAPRSMTEIEKARVQETFKDYIPRPQTATQSTGTTTTTASAGGTSTTTTQQGTGGTPGKKGGAETALEEEKRRAEEIRKEQEEAQRIREEAAKAAADRSFLSNTSLTATERAETLRSNVESADAIRRGEILNNLNLERDQVLAAIEKNAQRMEERRAKEAEGGRHNNPMTMNVLSDEDARLTTILGRLDRNIAEVENQAVDTNRPIEELLPKGVPGLEEETGVSARAADITRELLQQYEIEAEPTRQHNPNASKLFLDKVKATTEQIAAIDPALAEEISRAAIFGKEQVDNRIRFIYDARKQQKDLRATLRDLEKRARNITIPEALEGNARQIENIRKQLEFLR